MQGWALTAGSINPPIQIPAVPPISDFLLVIDDCEKHDITFFMANGDFKADEGATKCNDFDPQVKVQGTWAFNANRTSIGVTPASKDSYTMSISKLSATTLKFSAPFDFGNGTTHAVKLTLTAVK